MTESAKKIIFAFAVVALLWSCNEITFKEPQPKQKKTLHAVPRELWGKYLVIDDSLLEDTVIIQSGGFELREASSRDSSRPIYLSDSLKLKKYNGYYFVNSKKKSLWYLRVIKRERNGDLIVISMESNNGSFRDLIVNLSKEISVDSAEINGNKLYQIDPPPGKLVALIKKNYFKSTVWQKIKR